MRPVSLSAVCLALCLSLPAALATNHDDDTAPIEKPLPTIAAPLDAGEPDEASFDTEAPPPPPFDPSYRPPAAPGN